MSQSACYEQPLNERVRALLRLEFLFHQVDHALDGCSTWSSRAALQGLFDILALTGRDDLKRGLLKELERFAAILKRLRHVPTVHVAMVDSVLAEIATSTEQIHHLDTLALNALRQNAFLSAINKRNQSPGGTCRFDLPAFHYWLQQDALDRDKDLRQWLAPFDPLQGAVELILRTIRESAEFQPKIAAKGFFQQSLDLSAPNQLIRVLLSRQDTVFPEISGGKHRFTIRFLKQPDPNQRATQSETDVAFKLACCAI